MEESDKIVVRNKDEIKEAVISEYGFDAEVDAERIEKLVAKELDHDKRLSSAIGAKIKHRTEVEELKRNNPPVKVEARDDLPSKDIIYLAKADIHEEDLPDILDYSKKMGVDVSKAHDHYKPILEVRAEQRKSASVSNTTTTRQTKTKVDGDVLLKNLHDKGEIPDKGSKDAEELFWAKRGGKK